MEGTVLDRRMAGPVTNTTSVVVAGDAFDYAKGAAGWPDFTFVTCPPVLDEISNVCRAAAPCVLVIPETLLSQTDAFQFFRKFGSTVSILVLLASDDPEASERFLRLGCMGTFSTEGPPEQLLRAIHSVASGEIWASRRVLSAMLRELLPATLRRKLTFRENEILALVVRGYNNREIAEQLSITRETVRWHMRSLYPKIGVRDRRSAIAYRRI